MTTRWERETGHNQGATYAQRFADLAASGQDIHGEVALLEQLVPAGARILDAGCGTGRIAIELARRGFDVIGTDLDASMLEQARLAAPQLTWIEADLTSLSLEGVADPVDMAVLAGNVMIFLADGTERTVLERMSAAVRPGGLVVAGFSIGRVTIEQYDADAAAVGLELVDRFATWDREPFSGGEGAEYAVSVHRRSK